MTETGHYYTGLPGKFIHEPMTHPPRELRREDLTALDSYAGYRVTISHPLLDPMLSHSAGEDSSRSHDE